MESDEKRSPVQSIQFGDEDAVKTMKAVENAWPFYMKKTPCRSLEDLLEVPLTCTKKLKTDTRPRPSLRQTKLLSQI
jgi:hypothetical protein